MKNTGKALSTVLLTVLSTHVLAASYYVPPANQSLIGQVQTGTGSGEAVTAVTQRYNLGINALQSANPHLNMKRTTLPSRSYLQIPTQHILPNRPRQGIVINLPEMRMYYYLPGSDRVLTYPIGIGKIGKTIPIRNAIITTKKTNPTWIPPEDIREFNLEKGIVLPRIMPPGPDNPLGPYAIYMSIPTYLIHSTPFPESVGTRASFGCIRMYESDIKTFFPTITHGIPIAIVNSPVKVGWQNEKLYMEAHHPLEEHGDAYDASLPGMVHEISAASKDQPTLIDWQLVSFLSKDRDGVPHEVGMRIQ